MNAKKPSSAELAKTLVHANFHGVMSTLSTDGGYPFGSVIDYLPLSQGDVVVLLHAGAEHYRYLRADPRASLLVNPSLAQHDSANVARVTLLGEAKVVPDPSGLSERYLERHPDATDYVQAHELHFFQLDVRVIRYIPGSGRPVWLDAIAYRQAEPDPLGEEAPWLLHELNDREHTRLVRIAHNLLRQPWANDCRVISADRLGFDMVCLGEAPGGSMRRHTVRVGFDQSVSDRGEFERQFRKLSARAQLRAEPPTQH